MIERHARMMSGVTTWIRAGLVVLFVAIGGIAGLPGSAHATTPKIVSVKAEVQANGLYAFSVTLFHKDEGWGHYADKWDVMSLDGKVLGTRNLYLPNTGENPFTRSLANVRVPIGAKEVLIRAHCSVDGYGEAFKVALPPR